MRWNKDSGTTVSHVVFAMISLALIAAPPQASAFPNDEFFLHGEVIGVAASSPESLARLATVGVGPGDEVFGWFLWDSTVPDREQTDPNLGRYTVDEPLLWIVEIGIYDPGTFSPLLSAWMSSLEIQVGNDLPVGSAEPFDLGGDGYRYLGSMGYPDPAWLAWTEVDLRMLDPSGTALSDDSAPSAPIGFWVPDLSLFPETSLQLRGADLDDGSAIAIDVRVDLIRVPEPGRVLLLGLALFGVARVGRRGEGWSCLF